MSSSLETQPARTALAWQRTGLSLLLVAGLLARAAAVHGLLLVVVPTAVVAMAGLVVLGVLGPRRQRRTEVVARSDGDARAPRSARVVTGMVVLTALCGLATETLLRWG